jgi:hypothetical protein
MTTTDPTATPAADATIKTDTRDALAVDTRDPFKVANLDALAADPAKLATMSEQDIEIALTGTAVFDRSTEPRPEGDAPLHDMIRAAEAKATSEQAPAAAPTAPAVETQAPAAPAAAAPAAAAPATPTPAAAPAAVAAPAAEEPFVETRDGKGRISYSVLAEARRQVQVLRDRATAAETALAAAKAQPAGTPAAATPAVEPAEPENETFDIPASDLKLYTAEEIAALKQEFPEKVVDLLVSNNRLAYAALSRNVSLEQNLVHREQTAKATSTQDWIDQHPLASDWFNSEDPAKVQLAEEAIQMDEQLKQHATWGSKPSYDRMNEAIRRTAIINGIAIPSPAPTAVIPSGDPTQSLQARASAAIAAAAKTPQLPVTHSDLPPGGAPAQTERDVVNGLSATQLEASMEKMSPKQIEQFLLKSLVG